MRKTLATIAIAIASLTAFQGTAHAAVIDTDTAVLQTSGGYAKVVVNWSNLYGNGTHSVFVDDTNSNATCAVLTSKTTFEDGTSSAWTTMRRVCNGSEARYTGTNYAAKDIAKITFKLTVGSNVDTYAISPGGA